MEPFSIMMGYGLINSLSQLMIRPISDRLSVTKRQHEITSQMESKHRLDLEALRLNKQIEHDNQIDIQTFCHKCRIEEAQQQFERQLKMWQIGQFNDKMWPLLTPFDHPSLHPSFKEGERVPVNIFLAQTDPKSPFAILVQPDLKNRLSAFLQTAYASDPMLQHPTVCRIGDWKDGFQDAAFINALWFGLQGQPSIVVNPIQSSFGETLNLNISMWGLGENGVMPSTRNVMSGNFNRILGSLKREETKLWIEHGLPTTSPEMEQNRNLLEQEKIMVQSGHGEYVNELLPQYQLPREIQNKVISRFSSHYSLTISGITSMFADIYYLIEYGSKPYTPTAIRQYAQMNGSEGTISPIFAQHYHHALTTMVCTDYLQDRIPYAYLGVAESLNYDPDNAMQVFEEGVGVWANRKLDVDKDIAIPVSASDCVKQFHDNATQQDIDYLQQASLTLMRLNHKDVADEVDRIIKKLEKMVVTKSVNVQQADVKNANNTQASHHNRNLSHSQIPLNETYEEGLERVLKTYMNPDSNKYIPGVWKVQRPHNYKDGDLLEPLRWMIEKQKSTEECKTYTNEPEVDMDFLNRPGEIVVIRRTKYFAAFAVEPDARISMRKDSLDKDIMLGKVLLTDNYIKPKHSGYGVVEVFQVDVKKKKFTEVQLEDFKKRKYYSEIEEKLIPQLDDMVDNIYMDIEAGQPFYESDVPEYKLGYQSRTKLLDDPFIMKSSLSWNMLIHHDRHIPKYKHSCVIGGHHVGYRGGEDDCIKAGAYYRCYVERNRYSASFYVDASGKFIDNKETERYRRCEIGPSSIWNLKWLEFDNTGIGLRGPLGFDDIINRNMINRVEISDLPKFKDIQLEILRLDALVARLWKDIKNDFTCEDEQMKL